MIEACGCYTAGRHAAEHILKAAYRVDLSKALDPLNDDDFLVIIAQLTDKLSGASHASDKRAVQVALEILDVDYHNLTTAQISELTRATNLAIRNASTNVLPQVTGTIRTGMTDTVKGTKVSAAATHGWAINTAFDAIDQRMVDGMSRLGTWVLDEYGNRASMFASGAQRIIEEGLAQGLRNKDIARDLQRLGDHTANLRSAKYWNTVATNASTRARGYGHLRSMDDAGIAAYVYTAIMDERTTLECRALDGTVFPVSTGLKAYADLEVETRADPQAVARLMPFVQRKSLGNGVTELYVEPPGGARTVIAEAVGSAVGMVDTRGTFQNVLSPGQLAAAGVIVPPIHHLCRSTILPDI